MCITCLCLVHIVVAVEMLDAAKIRRMSKQSATLFDSYFFKYLMFMIRCNEVFNVCVSCVELSRVIPFYGTLLCILKDI